MSAILPSRVMNYPISAVSPTDDLLTLGQIYSEIGDYASTVLDREHLSLARRCTTRLSKVVGELVARGCIQSQNNLYDISPVVPVTNDLTAMTIGEMHGLYRSWPVRHKERAMKGREHFSFYYEGRIVRELQSRKTKSKGERLKIDYCVSTYNNELDNMSFILSLPVNVDVDKIYPDHRRSYSSDELTALIRLYSYYRDIMEREILVEYVDYALDLIEQSNDLRSNLGLITEIAEIRRKKIIHVPEWINSRLEVAVNEWFGDSDFDNSEFPISLLTLQMINGDSALERKAKRIINRCYKSAIEDSLDLDTRINDLHMSVMCCDYVTRFSVRKAATAWNDIVWKVLTSNYSLSAKQIYALLETAQELGTGASITEELKASLTEKLQRSAASNFPADMAYLKLMERNFGVA